MEPEKMDIDKKEENEEESSEQEKPLPMKVHH